MNRYAVWIEGYETSEEKAGARFLGFHDAEDFRSACKCAAGIHLSEVDLYYDAERNRYWGCRFFESGDDAVESFG